MSDEEVSADKLQERRTKAVQLRAAGCTYFQIGQNLAISESSAHGLVKREVTRLAIQNRESREVLRELIKGRLDMLHAAILAQSGVGKRDGTINTKLVSLSLKITEMQMAMYGVDEPLKLRQFNELLELSAADVVTAIHEAIPAESRTTMLVAIQKAFNAAKARAAKALAEDSME